MKGHQSMVSKIRYINESRDSESADYVVRVRCTSTSTSTSTPTSSTSSLNNFESCFMNIFCC